MPSSPAAPKAASSTTSMFSRSTTVTATIGAPRQIVWALLTDSARFPQWNSTVTSIDGPIELGSKLKLRVPISKRTFTPKVTTFDGPAAMTWRDGAKPMFWGVRDFTLAEIGLNSTQFTMTETVRGLMLPMAARSLPDFRPVFDRYVLDLQAAATARLEAQR